MGRGRGSDMLTRAAMRECRPELRDLLERYPDDWDEETCKLQVYCNSWRELTPGVIDGEAIAWYRYANCALLAVYLHRASGWPLVMVSTEGKTDNATRMIHVLCRRPDGRLVDIEGDVSDEEALEPWLTGHPDAHLEPMEDEESLLAVVGSDFDCYMETEIAVTEDFAQRLHREHSLS